MPKSPSLEFAGRVFYRGQHIGRLVSVTRYEHSMFMGPRVLCIVRTMGGDIERWSSMADIIIGDDN